MIEVESRAMEVAVDNPIGPPYIYFSQPSCVIVSGFRIALDLDTNPLSNLIRPRCVERAKPGGGAHY